MLALPVSFFGTEAELVVPVTLLSLEGGDGLGLARQRGLMARSKSPATPRPSRLDTRRDGSGEKPVSEVAVDIPTTNPAVHFQDAHKRESIEAGPDEGRSEQAGRIFLHGAGEGGGEKVSGAGESDRGAGFGGNGTRNGNGPGRIFTQADYAHNPKPPYPERAQREGWEGTVLLRVLVNQEGKAESVEVSRSSGFETLDRAAANTVKDWRFHPARHGEKAVESWVRVPIVFKLDRDRGS
jgi:protein TonB